MTENTDFHALKTRIRKNIERNEAALTELRAQLRQVEQLEAMARQAQLDLADATAPKKR